MTEGLVFGGVVEGCKRQKGASFAVGGDCAPKGLFRWHGFDKAEFLPNAARRRLPMLSCVTWISQAGRHALSEKNDEFPGPVRLFPLRFSFQLGGFVLQVSCGDFANAESRYRGTPENTGRREVSLASGAAVASVRCDKSPWCAGRSRTKP